MNDYAGFAVSGTASLIWLVFVVLVVVATWKIYQKAGEPGWGCLIPFYNTYLMMKIAMGNGWLFLLLFVPIVNAVVGIVAMFKLSSAFGHGLGFGFGLLFLSPIFMLILGFGSDEYQGPQ